MKGRMRKYLATMFGVAVGIAAAIVVAARSDEAGVPHPAATGGQEGGA